MCLGFTARCYELRVEGFTTVIFVLYKDTKGYLGFMV